VLDDRNKIPLRNPDRNPTNARTSRSAEVAMVARAENALMCARECSQYAVSVCVAVLSNLMAHKAGSIADVKELKFLLVETYCYNTT